MASNGWFGAHGRRVARVLAALLVTFGPLALAGSLSADGKASVESERGYYRSRGMPDPMREWQAEDYYEALTALEGMPPKRLPRLGGDGDSGLLFARLLAAREIAPQDVLSGMQGSSLLTTYAAGATVEPDLWSEVVEIARRELAVRCEAALPLAAIEAAREQEVALFEQRPEQERDGVRLAEQLAFYDESMLHVSREVGSSAGTLIRLGREEAMSQKARLRWVEAIDGSLTRVRERILEQEAASLAGLLRGLARYPWNATKQAELERLADLLQPDLLEP